MDDIVRLEQQKNTVLKTIIVEESRQTIRTGRNLEKDYNYSNGKILRLASPYGSRPIEVGLSRDLLLAGVIGNRLSREVESVPESPMLLLKDGKVTVLRQSSDPATPEKLNGLLRNIEGVQQIEIQRRRNR